MSGLADCSQVAEWPRGWEEEEGGGDLSFAHGAAGSTPHPRSCAIAAENRASLGLEAGLGAPGTW